MQLDLFFIDSLSWVRFGGVICRSYLVLVVDW